MKSVPSIMALHLRYRIWIAEMNFDINILRIFNDYLKELPRQKDIAEVKNGIDHFEKQFVNSRKEIDELRHEMHICKMKLGAYSREGKRLDNKTYRAENHSAIKKRYALFRKAFNKLKTEFSIFEGKWFD